MIGKANIILGSHAHIFPSATNEEFEYVYHTRLEPFIRILHSFPKIPVVLHYSGPLFSRLEQKKPELFLLIKDMTARKQIEILGGGFYEPLMPLLPTTDKIGQIEMLTTYIRQHFGRKPQGCLLAHSAWEQSMTGVLITCGMAYTFLSEEQFAAAANTGKSLLGPVITEDQGKLLLVFPIFSSLAKMGTEGIIPVLQKAGLDPNADPITKQECLLTVFPEFPLNKSEDAIHSFLADISGIQKDKSNELELTTPGRVYRTSALLSRLYFLPSGDPSCPQPRSFLTEHQEANSLYARFFFIHNLINQLRGDKARKTSAREELWKAQGAETLMQCNKRTIRRYAQKAILASERIIREKDFKPSLLTFDFNLDRAEEYLFQDKTINCYVSIKGASVFEFDYLPKGWNYLDILNQDSDQNKGFHQNPGSSQRCAFTDMLFPGDFIPSSDLSSGEYSFPGSAKFPENSRFCGTEEYRCISLDRTKLKATFVLAPRKDIPLGFIEIQKTYRVEKNILYLSYILSNKGENKTVLCFVPRFDLALAANHLLFRKSQGEEEVSDEKRGEKRRIITIEEHEIKRGTSLIINFQTPCDLYFSEQVPQTRCFLPVFQLLLNPGESWENQITVSISARTRLR